MSFEKKQKKRESKIWWTEKRKEYNLGLFLSGILAFILYIIIIEFFIKNNNNTSSNIEITIFSIFFQSLGFLVMMGFANIIYYGISGSELYNKTNDILKSRNKIYRTYFLISCILPFSIPLILFFYHI